MPLSSSSFTNYHSKCLFILSYKTTYNQNITQLKLTSSYTTSKELEQSFNDQQSIMNTTQFLRQRVTEHLIEFLNWFVLSQVSYVIKEEAVEMSVIELTCLTYSI